MTLKKKLRLIYGLLGCGFVLLVLSFLGGAFLTVPAVMGLAVVFAAVVLSLCWNHCPRCDAPLRGSFFPRFCSHCGEEIDYDAKQ